MALVNDLPPFFSDVSVPLSHGFGLKPVDLLAIAGAVVFFVLAHFTGHVLFLALGILALMVAVVSVLAGGELGF